MNKRFLTKKIKISTISEAEAKAKGLGETEKIQKLSKKHNDEGLKDSYTKLADLYDFDEGKDENALENPPKTTREESEDELETAALGPGQLALKYDNRDTDVSDEFDKRQDEINDHSEYYKEFGTDEFGFAAGEGKDTWAKLKGASKDYRKHRDEYQPTTPVRTTKNESTMKRMNYKQEFKDEQHMMSLIPESYKVDDNVFLMANVNESYQVRWEGDSENGEGVSLLYKNKEKINESKGEMKRLFNYKSSDVVGKTNDYINETVQFQKMMDVLREGKK